LESDTLAAHGESVVLRFGAMPSVFLLSPARCSGPRAEMLMSSATSALGKQLRRDGAPIGDVFAWLSALYFRGKLAYARAFAPPRTRRSHALVMAPGAGLVPPETPVTAAALRAMGTIEIESERFTAALARDAQELYARHSRDTQFVLLGSIATGKYVDTLLSVFAERLVFPACFVGRGDMSRGGLMLRAARSGTELEYAPVRGAVRRGARPPKLPRLPRGTDSQRSP
jgi:hypothetical protein